MTKAWLFEAGPAGILDKRAQEIFEAKCQLCDSGEVEDLEHIMWHCTNEELTKIKQKTQEILDTIVRTLRMMTNT